MSEIYVQAVGIAATGLPDWASARAVLRGDAAYVSAELPPYQPALLPPNERRRATPAVRHAFRAAENAITQYDGKPEQLAAVFASSDADLGIIDRISRVLSEAARAVSPTDFHNSVHNAAAGYWGIATGSRLPSTTICAYDDSFAVGLVEAATTIGADSHDTLLVAYDVPAPPLLHGLRPFDCAASTALVLGARRSAQSLAKLRLSLIAKSASTCLDDPALESLRLGNPATRGLPLLRTLARGGADELLLALPGGRSLRLEIFPP